MKKENIYSNDNLEALVFDLIKYLYKTKDYNKNRLSNNVIIYSMNKAYYIGGEKANYKLGSIPVFIEENMKIEDYFDYYYPNTLALSMDSTLSEYLYNYDVPNCEEVADKIRQIFNKHGFYYNFGSNWYLYAVPLKKDDNKITAVYDFTDDTLGSSKINPTNYEEYEKAKGLERYLMYRLSSNPGKDPDNHSIKLKLFYRTKYPKYAKSDLKDIYSDTMTSAQTLLSAFYIKEAPEEWKHFKEVFCPKAKGLSAVAMSNILTKIDEFPKFKAIFVSTTKKYVNVREFINLYHTIGNYIPVAKYFNSNRSGAGASAIHDMWDLTLTKIFNYYQLMKVNKIEEADYSLQELLHLKKMDKKSREILQSTKDWLDSYQSWKNFIKENYLQDYVDINTKDWNIILEFTSIHNWDNPYEIEDYLAYFKLLVETIEKRADRILKGE